MPKKFQAKLNSSDNKLWSAHIEVPEKVALSFGDGASRRVVCRLNDTIEFQCGILRGVTAKYVITVNKKIRTQLGVNAGDELKVVLREDSSEYGLPITDELSAALSLDEEANKFFQALTPGARRTLLYIASNVKNPDTRVHRAVTITQHLVESGGRIDYKKLNIALKKPKV